MSPAAERLRAKLRALLAKTVDNGCTEGEAAAAAEKARALMAEHGLSGADLAQGEVRSERETPRPAWHDVILNAVTICTNTVVQIEEHCGGSEVYVFIGAEPGPEIALYLRELALRAVDTAIAAFRASPVVAGQRLWLYRERAVTDFTDAFTARLGARLVEIFAGARDEAALGRALARRYALYPDGQVVVRARRRTRDARAFAAGAAAAESVGLHHAMRGAAGERARLGGCS